MKKWSQARACQYDEVEKENKTLQVVHVGCEEARMWRVLHDRKLASLQS